MPHRIIQVFIAVKESVQPTLKINLYIYLNMTAWVFSVLIIQLIIIAAGAQSSSNHKDRESSISHRGELKKQSEFREYSNLDSNLRLNRDHYEVRKRRSKKKRQTIHLAKAVPHGKQHGFHNRGNDEKIYETFEEIHEHINEPSSEDSSGHTQATERLETHEEAVQSVGEEKKKEEGHVRIKVKHHHHHHHHNHIKEVIKTVPKPYKVEKIVHVPIEKIVEKIIHVPKIVNVTVEKVVHVPVEKIIEKIVQVPKAVHIPKPYVVEKIMEKIVHVPKPYPVLRTVPYPVEIKVPVTVEKKVPVPYKVEVERKVPIFINNPIEVERKVPVPFKVEVERKVPVYIHDQEPYKYEQTYPKSTYKEKDVVPFNSDAEETTGTENYPRFLPPYHNSNKIGSFKKPEQPQHLEFQGIKQAGEQQTHLDTTGTENYPRFLPQYYNSNKLGPFRKSEQPQNLELQGIKQHVEQQANIDTPKGFTPTMEQSTSESQFLPVKFLDGNSQFNIIVADNNSTFVPNFGPQMYENKFHELQFPVEFIHVQPVPFRSNLKLEMPFPGASFNST